MATQFSELPIIRRVTASNLPLPSEKAAASATAEPGVDVTIDTLESDHLFGGTLVKTNVATTAQIPASNDGYGSSISLDPVPAPGIVLPGGVNAYYIDLAPNTPGVMHRTTSTDYLVVLQGTLSLVTPPAEPFELVDGNKPDYKETVDSEAHAGEVVIQRGMMHALANRTDKWVRLFAVVLDAEPNRVPIGKKEGDASKDFRTLGDAWCA